MAILRPIHHHSMYIVHKHSDAVSGWAGWALAHLEFGRSVSPITTRGADYAHHITDSLPVFKKPAASLYYVPISIKYWKQLHCVENIAFYSFPYSKPPFSLKKLKFELHLQEKKKFGNFKTFCKMLFLPSSGP